MILLWHTTASSGGPHYEYYFTCLVLVPGTLVYDVFVGGGGGSKYLVCCFSRDSGPEGECGKSLEASKSGSEAVRQADATTES